MDASTGYPTVPAREDGDVGGGGDGGSSSRSGTSAGITTTTFYARTATKSHYESSLL